MVCPMDDISPKGNGTCLFFNSTEENLLKKIDVWFDSFKLVVFRMRIFNLDRPGELSMEF